MNDVRALRVRRLRALIEERYRGVALQFATQTGKKPSYVNDVLAGRKSFGEKVVRALEKQLQLEPLYFDHDDTRPRHGAPAPRPWPFSFDISRFENLTPGERKACESVLLTMMAAFESTHRGRRTIRRVA